MMGAPEVRAAASPSAVRIGQPIALVITATYGAGVSVNLPDPLVLGDGFEAGRRDTSDRVRSDGRRVREWQVRVYAWEVGDLQIPPVPVTFTAGGHAAVVTTNGVPIRVEAVLGAADDPRPRAMTSPVSLWRRSWALLIYAGAALALIALVLGWWIRRRRRKRARARARIAAIAAPAAVHAAPVADDGDQHDDGEPHREEAPPPPPFVPPAPSITTRPRRKLDRLAEEAIARLRAIEASGRLDTDRRDAYRDMVDVIRWYLGARYHVDSAELTTRELCEALIFRSADAAALTRAWLADCDLVKYANRHASGDEARTILDGACWLVDRTSPGADAAPVPREGRRA